MSCLVSTNHGECTIVRARNKSPVDFRKILVVFDFLRSENVDLLKNAHSLYY